MPISEARKRANAKYNAKAYDRVEFKVKKGNKSIIENAAKEEGKSLNVYVVEAVDKQLISSGKPSILDKQAPQPTPEQPAESNQPKEKNGLEYPVDTAEDGINLFLKQRERDGLA